MDEQDAVERAPERTPEMAQRAPLHQPPPRPRRPFRSTLAVTSAGILLIIGIVLSLTAFASLSQPARPELGPAFAMTALVSQAALLVVGMLNVAAALGIYLHSAWARRLGIALSILGLVASIVFFIGPLSNFRVGLLDPLMLVTVVALLGYGLSLLALLVAGSHFRPRTS
jgi:hypothetical protein